ncbi:hypothetical protein [Blastopirellula marina]|uniref:Uncharacterized protein n=1 Tax=Blastopirellula marina DSM 3645 TaxID=314230 RepID=A3ZPK9_9BACT|nr:hypothetical protein [Blastopirellula marina]EAQ81687.1 hypothetical protein DSM3645_28937 [Blastopirellula marina DSM 3645]
MLTLPPPTAPTPLSYYRIRSIQDKVDGVYYWLKAARSPEQQTLFADLQVAKNLLNDLPVLLDAERHETDRRWRTAIQAIPSLRNESLAAAPEASLTESRGWSDIQEDHPAQRRFESHETGVGCYEFEAEFHFVRGPMGDQLHGVTITSPLRLDEDELVEVTRAAELRLLANEAETWWEGRR